MRFLAWLASYVRPRPVRVAIYTAVFGSYDFLKRPTPQIGVHVDFYCFSDEAAWGDQHEGWRHHYVPADPAQHPRMQAKRFKILSHEVFPRGRLASRFSRSFFRPRHDVIIWVDASLRIRGNRFAERVAALCEENALVVYSHPDRDSILEEVNESIVMLKYQGLPLKEQVEFYISKGLNARSGLFACGVIGRRCPEGRAVRRFDEAWWAENLHWSYQDQLSFAYLASRTEAKIKTIPGNLWNNAFFDYIEHRSDK